MPARKPDDPSKVLHFFKDVVLLSELREEPFLTWKTQIEDAASSIVPQVTGCVPSTPDGSQDLVIWKKP